MSGPAIFFNHELDQASEIIQRGGVIGYPTETVYGLGGIATNPEVVTRIQRLKGRRSGHPMLILIPDSAYLSDVAEDIPEDATKMMHCFWPGPLTLIFQAKSIFPNGLTGKDGGIGIRVSSDPICRELFKFMKDPLISTSANPSDLPPARSAEAVRQYFKDRVDAVIDGGPRNRNAPSTVIDVRVRPARLIRRGSIKMSRIQSVVGEING
jgi:L-threonylcarbamoyladenylate synthase